MRWAAEDVSAVTALVLTLLFYFLLAMTIVALIASSIYGVFMRHDKRRRIQTMAKRTKRLCVKLGQRLEVEYMLLPATKGIPADVELLRVLAFQGAVCIDVMPLLHECAEDTLKSLTDRCAEAESLRAIRY
jgi:hypothetical protein